MTKDENIGFTDSVLPEIADNYRRLDTDKRLVPVFEKLKKRGLTDPDKEFLLRRIALLPQDWEAENEGWKQGSKRRATMASKLRKLAELVAADPDLSRLRLSADKIAFPSPPGGEDELQTVADVMNVGALFLETTDGPPIATEDGESLSTEEYEQLNSPKRKTSLKTYALLSIFEMLEPFFEPAEGSLPPRAPNKIVETLCSVLLQEDIESGTVSKLRPDDRRKYTLDPK